MGKRLYVGNLPYRMSEEELATVFSQAGTVANVAIIMDRETGRSKGFAFVEMSSQSEVQKAISLFSGYSLNDRPLTVNVARPREERGGFGKPAGGFRQQRGGKDRRRF